MARNTTSGAIGFKIKQRGDKDLSSIADYILAEHMALVENSEKFQIVEGASALFGADEPVVKEIIMVIALRSVDEIEGSARIEAREDIQTIKDRADALGAEFTYIEKRD